MAVAHRSTTTPQFGNATTLAVNLPGSIAAGELLLVWLICNNAVTDTAWSATAGWTEAAQLTNTTHTGNRWRGACFYRVADGSEGASVTFGTLNSARKLGGCSQAYTGVDTTTPMDATAVASENDAGTTTPTLPSITTVSANAMLVGGLLWGAATNGTITPPLANERVDAADATQLASIEISDEIQAAAGASGTKAGTATTNSRFIQIMLALRPATAAAEFSGWGVPI